MLNATTFTYDGVYSGQYGLLIASLESESTESTSVLSPTVKTIKTTRRNRSSFAGLEYEENQPLTFSIISEVDIPDIIRREILSWLVGREGFKKLQIHQPDYDDYTYNCIFTDAEVIYVNGSCKGFTITANFDSPFCYGRPYKKTVNGDGVDYETVTILNNSDTPDNYVYPLIVINPNNSFIDGKDGEGNDIHKEISIKNISDTSDTGRLFEFSGLLPNLLQPDEELCVDNELRVITKRKIGETATNPIGNALGAFNKKWLRLKKGVNRLEIKIDGSVTIEVPQYVLIGF